MYAIELLPHDTHEILNVSGVVDSGLTVDDFRNSGFENVEEVYQFPKYDMAGNVVDKITKSNTYGRFCDTISNFTRKMINFLKTYGIT